MGWCDRVHMRPMGCRTVQGLLHQSCKITDGLISIFVISEESITDIPDIFSVQVQGSQLFSGPCPAPHHSLTPPEMLKRVEVTTTETLEDPSLVEHVETWFLGPLPQWQALDPVVVFLGRLLIVISYGQPHGRRGRISSVMEKEKLALFGFPLPVNLRSWSRHQL